MSDQNSKKASEKIGYYYPPQTAEAVDSHFESDTAGEPPFYYYPSESNLSPNYSLSVIIFLYVKISNSFSPSLDQQNRMVLVLLLCSAFAHYCYSCCTGFNGFDKNSRYSLYRLALQHQSFVDIIMTICSLSSSNYIIYRANMV